MKIRCFPFRQGPILWLVIFPLRAPTFVKLSLAPGSFPPLLHTELSIGCSENSILFRFVSGDASKLSRCSKSKFILWPHLGFLTIGVCFLSLHCTC